MPLIIPQVNPAFKERNRIYKEDPIIRNQRIGGDRAMELANRGFPDGYPADPFTPATQGQGNQGTAGVPDAITPGYAVDPLDVARKLAAQRRLASNTDLFYAQTDRDLGYAQVLADRNRQERTRKFDRGLRTLADPYLSSGLNNSGITNRGYTDYRVDYATDISNVELELQRQRSQLLGARDKALRELALSLGLDEEDLLFTGATNIAGLPTRIVPPGGLTQ